MRPTDNISELIKKLHLKVSSDLDKRVHEALSRGLAQSERSRSSVAQPDVWRTILKTKTARFTAAAAVAVIVIGGMTFWPGGSPQNGEWWLGPPAAWGQQIIAELEKVEALVYRDQTVFVGRFGSTHVSGTWSRNYEAKDRSREDRYYEPTDEDTFGQNNPGSVLQHVIYQVPDGQDLIQYDVSYEHQCYTIRINKGGAYQRDPIKRLRFCVALLENANRILGTATFEGRECVGFETSADKYGKNPDDWIDRIWFDVETKLPVRIEMHGLSFTDQPVETYTSIQDQFEYYAQVPADMFEPDIPDSFINAEPDEIRAAKTAQEKGPMLYADVPDGFQEKVTTALKGVNTAVYRRHYGSVKDGNWIFNPAQRVYISEYDWRIDSYSGEQVQRTAWYATNKDDWGKTSFDFNDRNFRLIKTTVHFSDRFYSETTYGHTLHPDNPMDEIIYLAEYIDRADRFFERRQVEGIECFGFELSAKKYGDNPDTYIHTLWFDSETMLPVRMEFEQIKDDGTRKTVLDQFEWNPELPADTFVPEIPEGFVNDHPDEIRAAGEKER